MQLSVSCYVYQLHISQSINIVNAMSFHQTDEHKMTSNELNNFLLKRYLPKQSDYPFIHIYSTNGTHVLS